MKLIQVFEKSQQRQTCDLWTIYITNLKSGTSSYPGSTDGRGSNIQIRLYVTQRPRPSF